MNWIPLTKEEQLDILTKSSYTRPQLIFKHSIRCSISTMAKNRLDKAMQPADIDFHYLDLINYRAISNKVADRFGVQHQSPQVLMIKDGKCVYDESHMGIAMDEIEAAGM